MKVILDTNVLMSAIFWKGVPGKIMNLWAEYRFDLVLSKSIFEEYKRVSKVLQRKFNFDNTDQILDMIALRSIFVEPKNIEHLRCDDPNDDMFLAAAVYASAKYIVTGDKALLRVNKFSGGLVVTPQSFVDLFAAE